MHLIIDSDCYKKIQQQNKSNDVLFFVVSCVFVPTGWSTTFLLFSTLIHLVLHIEKLSVKTICWHIVDYYVWVGWLASLTSSKFSVIYFMLSHTNRFALWSSIQRVILFSLATFCSTHSEILCVLATRYTEWAIKHRTINFIDVIYWNTK